MTIGEVIWAILYTAVIFFLGTQLCAIQEASPEPEEESVSLVQSLEACESSRAAWKGIAERHLQQ